MKTLIGLLTFGTAILMAPLAEARGHSHGGPTRTYVEFHRSCGGPAYIERYVAYYDDCGYPVFRTRIVPVYRRAPVYRPAYCEPVVRPYVRPGITIHLGGGSGGHGGHRGHGHGRR